MRPFVALLATAALVAVVPAWAQEPGGTEVGPVPTGAVAVVGESEISRQQFDRWLRTAAVGDAPRFWRNPAVPGPPRHRECVATLRQRLADPPGRRPLRRRCARLFERLMPEAMTFLIQARWIALEARMLNISVSERRVERQFREQKRETFPTERAFRRFLRRSGMTRRQILFRIRTDIRQRELAEHITRSVPPDERAAAFERYTQDFTRRYRAQTRCASGFVVRDCGAPG